MRLGNGVLEDRFIALDGVLGLDVGEVGARLLQPARCRVLQATVALDLRFLWGGGSTHGALMFTSTAGMLGWTVRRTR